MQQPSKDTILGAGAVLAALGASLCCLLPIAVALVGVGSAAVGARLEPLRPWFAVTSILLLGVAFYRAYRPVECAPGEACAIPASRRRARVVLWLVALVAVALMAFPYYASRIL